MFGVEFSELLLFTRQLGLALVGAVSLWGFVFTKWAKHNPKSPSCVIYEWIAARMLLPLALGIVLVLVSWLLLSSFPLVSAHEGIVLTPEKEALSQGAQTATPLILLLALLFASLVGAKRLWPKAIQENLEWFYAAHLILALFLMAQFAWHGELNREQFFFWGHSMHSILTIGTVLVLDFLFLMSKPSTILKQHIYPLFPTMSKVIWVGLGIDFLSVALVFQEAISLTPKFFFMQTVVAILIINGVLLAGPIARNMIASVQQRGARLTSKWKRIADTAGVISITSWGTITLVDFFENITLNYVQLLLAYAILLTVVFAAHMFLEHLHKKPPAFLHTS